jgi:electron transfer flavoprotein beta subunit
VVNVEIDEGQMVVRRDMEDGYQTVRSTLPAVLLSSTGLEQPRLPSLKGIMAAKKKPVESFAVTLPGTSHRLGSTVRTGENYLGHDRARRSSS